MPAQRLGGPCEAPSGYTSRSYPTPRSDAASEKVREPEPSEFTSTSPNVVMWRLGLPVQSRCTWTSCAPVAMPVTETVTVPAPKASAIDGAGGAGAGVGGGAVGAGVGVGGAGVGAGARVGATATAAGVFARTGWWFATGT